MGKKEILIEEINKLRMHGIQKITMTQLHDLLMKNDIITASQRSDYTRWLAVKGEITIDGQILTLRPIDETAGESV